MQTKRLMATLMITGLALGGCGGSDTTASGDTDEGTQIEGLVKPDTLIMATTGNFPPFTFIGEDGEVDGYSIDIGQEIADRLGLKFESPTVDFVAELQGLSAGQYDLADSGIWPTEERQNEFLFSVPVASTGFVATTLEGNLDRVTGLDDLEGLQVGAVQGSTREAWLIENEDDLGYASYKGYPGASQALLDLENARIDLIVDDPLLAFYYIEQNPGEVTTAGDVTLEHPLSLAINLEATEVQTAVNEVLTEMLEDGTILEFQEKYWGRAIPVPADINDEPPYPTLD